MLVSGVRGKAPRKCGMVGVSFGTESSMNRFKAPVFVVVALAAVTSALAQSGPTVPTISYGDGFGAAITGLGAVIGNIWPFLAVLAALPLGLRLVMKFMKGAGK